MRRVVITGIGAVTPLGNTFETSWDALLKKKVGTGPNVRFDPKDSPYRNAGQLKRFNPEVFISKKDVLRLDPFVQYAAAAARMAVQDAELKSWDFNNSAVIIGSSRGGISSMEAAMTDRATAYLMAGSTVSMAASYVSKLIGVKGHVLGISNACASGANAIGEALRLIRCGYAEMALVGGAEAPITPLAFAGYGAAGALSEKGVMRPFDLDRDGFVLAEGATVLVLEEYAAALKRTAKMYGEVLGYGNTSDAQHMTEPDSDSQARAMRAALNYAGVRAKDVGYVNAHATATAKGDTAEAESIAEVFGMQVPVSASKSMTGHMLGASGAFEAAVTLRSIREGVIPPTANLENFDCALNHVTEAQKAEIRYAVSNSFGFGGVNAVLVLGPPPP